MADKARIKELIIKKLLGGFSPEEDNELEVWADQSAENRHFLDVRMNPTAVREKLRAIVSVDTSGVDRRLREKIGGNLLLLGHLDILDVLKTTDSAPTD